MEDKEYLNNFVDTVPTEEGAEDQHAPQELVGTEFLDTLPADESFDPPPNMGRRSFLKTAGAVVAGTLATGVTGVAGKLYGEKIYGETLGKEEEEKKLMDTRERLRRQCGIEVDFSGATDVERGAGVGGEQVRYVVEKRKMCESIERCLMMYPPMMYKKRATFSRIRIMDNLGPESTAMDGAAIQVTGDLYIKNDEHRAEGLRAEMDLAIGKIFSSDSAREKRVRQIMHHELEHLVDSVDTAKWNAEARGIDTTKSPSPDDLNSLYISEALEFVRTGVPSPEEIEQYKTSERGFPNRYAKKDQGEDRASIIEYLYELPDVLARRIPDDPELARKVDFMKKEYFTMSRGVMDAGYWDVVRRNPDNPKIVAEYVRLRSQLLVNMQDGEFQRLVSGITGRELNDEEIAKWKSEIALDLA